MKDRPRSKKALFQISKVLWHLDIFRRSFRELSGHTCMLDTCIFCALKELFSQLQFSHESALPPDALRRALAESFFDQQRFQLGFMDDAAECFENILVRIHFHLAGGETEDLCSAGHCIPHIKFAMTLVEQSVCSACGATSEPLPFTQMVHYVSASALISQAKQSAAPSNPDLFGQLLKKAGGMGDIRDCPSACGAKIQIRRTLTNHPEIVSVGIVWDSERPSLEHIMALLTTLRTTLRLKEVFHTPNPGPGAAGTAHQLVGVVTYYGKHYSTFFFHTKLKIWIYFDDANVREVGPKWEQVVDKCRRGRYQPLLLLYSAPDGSPIDASSAPRSVTVAPSASKPPLGRRSLTPSPEKPSPVSAGLLAQRRAMTPNPDHSQPQPIDTPIQRPTQTLNDYQNFPQLQAKWNAGRTDLVRRDSGNWSGDRNSASSSSSTSLENPYQYILGKMQHHRSQVVPRSPTSLKGGESSSGGSQCDLGYDSYSLSSTDSLPLQQTLKHNLQLAQIPEGHHSPASLSNIEYAPKKGQSECERLCDEADLLLKHSQETEDLKEALSLATAAAGKARQAMDAPYSNPQAASAARIKHSTCIMQARSLHKRLEEPNGPRHGEGRHSREGSGSHSRQNSRDKGNHSRQNSRELLQNARELQASKDLQSSRELLVEKSNPPEVQLAPTKDPEKSIEIYATLPKRGKGLLSRAASKVKNMVEDEEYLMYDRPGRSLSRNKPPNGKKDEKRARSEERNNKSQKENNGFVSNQISKEAKKQAKAEEQKQKKQHKVRRKLLMGGLIRRKNRSMPDLREDEVQIKGGSKDDTNVGKTDKQQPSLSGYLSEGHLEYSGNPNLERSRLMRKSFHGSKLIQMAKVPPPPPLRTTSQLSKSERPPFPLPENTLSLWKEQEPQSLPPMSNYMEKNVESVTYANGGYLLNNCQTKLVTTAQVHQVASPDKEYREPKGDEEDEFDLPPYPSPLNSVTHSRQASEEFPPPPAEIESLTPSTLLEQLQKKRQQILNDNGFKENTDFSQNDYNNLKVTRGENWLKELQAKQAAIKGRDCPDNENKAMLTQKMPENKINGSSHPMQYSNQTDAIMVDPDPNSSTTVKDLKSKFENFTLRPTGERKIQKSANEPSMDKVRANTPTSMANRTSPVINNVEQTSKEIDTVPPPSPSSKSSSDVEIKSNLVNGSKRHDEIKRRPSKKKNVTFCEQVVLVATAEEDKVNSYIPNPILERVLRSVLHRDSPHQETKEIAVHSVVPLKRNDSGSYGQCSVRNGIQNSEQKDVNGVQEDSNLQQNMKESNESKSAQCVGLPQPERSVTDGPSSGGVNNRPFSFQRMLPSPVPNRPPTRMQLSPQMSNIPYQQGVPNHILPQQQQNLQNSVSSNNVPEQTSSSSPYIPMHVLQSYHAEDTYLMARNNGMQQQMANRVENQGLQPLGIARPEMNGLPSRDCEQKGSLHGDYSEFNGLSVSGIEHPLVYSQMGGVMQQCHAIPPVSNGMNVQQTQNGMTSGPMSLPTSQHYSPPTQYSTVNAYNGTTMVPPMNLIQPKTSNMPQYQGLPSSIHNPQYLPHPSSNVGSQSINGQMLNGSHMSALRHQQILQQQQQMQQGLPNYQSPPNLQQQRNLPSPSLHGQTMSSMQPQFAQPTYQRVPTNMQVHGALKNPSPVPNGIHSDQQPTHMTSVAQHQLANLQPHSYSTLPTYPSHVPNSTSQQNIQNQSTTSTINLMQHQSNNIPSPSLSIKSQMLLNHSQLSVHQGNSSQNQSCYMPLPQKMRSPIVGGAPVGTAMPAVQTKRPQGMYQPDLQEYGQHLMKNGRSEVYQRVPNIIHPGEYAAGQQYPPSGPLSPTYPGGPVPNGLAQPQQQQQQQCLAPQPQLSGAAAPLSVKYSPYQHPPMSQQTKAPPGSGPPTQQQQPAPTPLTRSPLCSLCRKKQVAAPSIYCTDCDFYMSRFKPRT